MRPISVGAELTIDALGYDVAALMARQGDPGVDPRSCAVPPAFGTGCNGAAVTLPITLSLDLHDSLAPFKRALLAKASLKAEGHAFVLRLSHATGLPAPPSSLLAYARLAVLEPHDRPLLPPDEAMPLAPLSASNEEHAFRLIAASLEAKLAGYASAVEEDEFVLSSHAARGAGGGGGGARARGRSGSRGGGSGIDGSRERRLAAVATVLLEKRLLAVTQASCRMISSPSGRRAGGCQTPSTTIEEEEETKQEGTRRRQIRALRSRLCAASVRLRAEVQSSLGVKS